jgi:hypothetical protein
VTELIRETLGDVLGCEGRRVVRLCHDLQASTGMILIRCERSYDPDHMI